MAGLLVMAAMAGSLVMNIAWWHRIKGNVNIFPLAVRKPLRVPRPLMIGGIVLAAFMALTVLLASLVPEDAIAAAANGEANATAEAEASPDSETSSVDNSDPASADDPDAESGTTKPRDLKKKLQAMMWQTLSVNGMMFIVIGFTVWISQAQHSRRLNSYDDVSYPQFAEMVAFPEEVQSTDLPIPAETMTSYDEPDPTRDPFVPPASVLAGNPAATTGNPEPWSLPVELRFAFETFLVAYLPTAMLRMIIMAILPEAPSHPFLELLADGVEWNIMALIAIMAVIVAPLVEELLYRVTILGGIWQQKALPAAWVLSSVLFSFAHGFPDSIALLPLAFAIGYTYVRRRSYRTVVLVHFLFNAFNMVIAGVSMV